jgi:hypothetical protein
MARYSEAAQGFKLEDGDLVSSYGVKGKVQSVQVIRSKICTDVLVEVDFTRGQGNTNFLHLADIEAFKLGHTEWVDLKGEPVAV